MNNSAWSNITFASMDFNSAQEGYSNPDYTDLVFTATYDAYGNLLDKTYSSLATYYSGSGLLESSRPSPSPDASGNVYYHYINENFELQGYGRVDKEVRAAADGDGAIAYLYEYHPGVEVVKKKTAYKTADYSDPSNPVLSAKLMVYEYDAAGTLTRKYSYYDDANNYQQSTTLYTADGGGNIYYYYLNEAAGRMEMKVLAAAEADGTIAYAYSYSGATENYLEVIAYSQADYSDPADPVLEMKTKRWVYDGLGNAAGNVTEKNTYYADANNRMRSKELSSADGSGNVYYRYINEAGSKADVVVRAAADVEDNAYAYKYTYHVNGEVATRECYASGDYSDPNTPVVSEILAKYEYTDAGVQTTKYTYYYHADTDNYMESKTLAAADGSGNVYYHWIDENFEAQGYGRVDRIVKGAAEADGTKAYFYEYSAATDNYAKVIGYALADYSDPKDPVLTRQIKVYTYDGLGNDAANIIEQSVYYNDVTNYLEANMLKAADVDGNLYYHFINEDYNSTGQGRLDEKVIAVAEADGTKAYTYTYTGVTGNYDEVIGYTTADYSDLRNAAYTTMSKKWVYDGLGNLAANMTEKYTYYTDVNNRMQSKEFADADVEGNVYYHYLNADGFKADVVIRDTADADDNAYAYKYTYHPNGVMATKECYASGDYSDPNDPTVGTNLAKYEYDNTGAQTAKYTYYVSDPMAGDFDGAGDYLTVPDNAAWAFGAGNFTVDMWVKLDATGGYQTIYSQGTNDSNYSYFAWTGSGWQCYYTGGASFTAADSLTAGTWYHVALVRNGNNVSIYRDGVLKGSTVSSWTMADYTGVLCIGNLHYGTGQIAWYLNGQLKDFRMSDTARWTDGFTAPDEVTNDADTRLLLEMRGTAGSTTFTDSSSNGFAVTAYGNTQIVSAGAGSPFTGTNYMESKTLAAADGSGNVYYHWIDENFEAQGYGRVDRIVKGAAEADGTKAYYYEYSAATSNYAKVIGYVLADYSDPKDPTLTRQIKVYTYDGEGNDAANITKQSVYYNDVTNYLEANMLKNADDDGNLYYHFINENYNSTGQGRLDEKILAVAEVDGTKAYTYTYTGVTGNYDEVIGYTTADYSDLRNAVYTTMSKKWVYDGLGNAAGNMTEKHTYYLDANNRLQSKELAAADGTGNIYYHYFDADGVKVDAAVRNTADASDNAWAYKYTYHENGEIATKECYASGDYADPNSPVMTGILAKYEYTDAGVQTAKNTYYYHAGTEKYIESRTLAAADEYGNVYYHYYDENFDGQGYGRVDKQARVVADADGAIAYYYEYHAGTDDPSKKVCYRNVDLTNPRNPSLTGMIKAYEYAEDGTTVNFIYTYDEDENLVKKEDNVEGVTTWYISDTLICQYVHTDSDRDDAGTYYSWNVSGANWSKNTQKDPDGTYTEFHYNVSGNLTGADRINGDRSVYSKLNGALAVTEETTLDPAFARGENLPRVGYGYAIGVATRGEPAGNHWGFSLTEGYKSLVARLKEGQ
ncbi:MAG: LamG domain-containing protein, partial [Candidatus Omnitrophica bacterium]|nr:LamG domain-containing protein [Candidatus Omnitrophota bacterium]